jgi:hypothetical protein
VYNTVQKGLAGGGKAGKEEPGSIVGKGLIGAISRELYDRDGSFGPETGN